MDSSIFSRCLRDLRVSRGFVKARHFADAVGIGENRYTRYERGEAEPNIALIYKFCEVLHVQPNELFGFGPATGGHTAGFAEQKVADFEVAPMGEVAAQVLGWKLARSMVRLHAVEAGSAVPTGMAEHRAAATAFMELERAPVHTVSTFLARHSFARVAKSELDELTALVEQYLALLYTRAGSDRPAK